MGFESGRILIFLDPEVHYPKYINSIVELPCPLYRTCYKKFFLLRFNDIKWTKSLGYQSSKRKTEIVNNFKDQDLLEKYKNFTKKSKNLYYRAIIFLWFMYILKKFINFRIVLNVKCRLGSNDIGLV